MTDFFTTVPEPIRFEGPESDNPLAFRWYDADRVVGEKTAEHLRMAVCYWHSFNWPGNDVFGDGTFDRPWLAPTSRRWSGPPRWQPPSSSSRSLASRTSASTTTMLLPPARRLPRRPPT